MKHIRFNKIKRYGSFRVTFIGMYSFVDDFYCVLLLFIMEKQTPPTEKEQKTNNRVLEYLIKYKMWCAACANETCYLVMVSREVSLAEVTDCQENSNCIHLSPIPACIFLRHSPCYCGFALVSVKPSPKGQGKRQRPLLRLNAGNYSQTHIRNYKTGSKNSRLLKVKRRTLENKGTS